MPKVYLKYDNTFKEVVNVGKKENGEWTSSPVSNIYVKQNGVWTTGVTGTTSITSLMFGRQHTLTIGGASTIVAETCQYVAIYDNRLEVTPTWSIISGGTYATIAIDGTVTINSNANNSPVTIQAEYNGLTATKDVVLTYLSGSTSETTTETVVDIETGEVTTTTTTTTENQDGSSQVSTECVYYNENGEIEGSTTNETTKNTDGSSTSTTINYDENGDPIDKTNEKVDTSGNVDTQQIEYDENGEEVVTGYDIDTSDNPDGVKKINGEEVNTEFYAFDTTHAFELMLHFYYDPAKQKVQQATILNAKKTEGDSNWYGFDLRRKTTSANIEYGAQFSTGKNNRANITMNSNHIFKIKVTYDPTVESGNTFVMYDMINNKNIFTGNGIFEDDETLKYIKITIGCSLDANGNPERRAVMDVYDFYVKRIEKIAAPVITCSENQISITSTTAGATIYYRLRENGPYSVYTSPITINTDTVVQAYVELNGDKSNIVTETCLYDNGITTPAS